MQLLAKFKKILYMGFRATLNFRKKAEKGQKGLCCDYFNIERGVRQGDPLSPYLFVTAVEILAIAIRNKYSITGIEINDLETKLLQFADDTTAVLSDLNSANTLFSLLKEFGKASGLKLNVKKTEAM